MAKMVEQMAAAASGSRVLKLRDEHSHRVLAEVVVSEAVYRAYYQEREHASYLAAKARRHELSWNQLADECGMPVEAHMAQSGHTLDAGQRQALDEALALLSPEMREALWQLVCGETTERALAQRWGISQPAVHRRKQRALQKLRHYLEASGCHD
ncbi:MAG: sigma factor-like helix-turn-helix DNA-binding protein [Peptococcaceae bacterium]|nr:sigma factor-like helix-turn-helix DNA-binding protein [Peptococcaceae bacterium]